MKKQKFKKQFAKKVFTRFHMFLILLGTILSGIIFSKILLIFGLQHMVFRFIIVLFFSYFCFFLLMKLWLHYLTTPYRKNKRNGDLIDTVDLLPDIPESASTNVVKIVSGQGGEFGGAGASSSYVSANSVSEIPASGSIAETATETAGDAISGLADEGAVLLIPLALLLLVILGGGIYLIYEAPMIISEAAFELVLATSLIKKAKKIDNPDWIGSVLRSTWPAFALTFVITIIAGWVLMVYCPQATKITEIIKFCL